MRKVLTILSLLVACEFLFHPVTQAQSSVWFPVIDSSKHNHDYAYSPVIIKTNGYYYTFACSIGEVGGSWDYVRMTKMNASENSWSSPQIVVRATNYNGQDTSACDPGIVYFNGYYYLYYSSAYQVGNAEQYQTIIQVARSLNIEGPYYTYTQRGTLEITPKDPQKIIMPAIKHVGGYGAGMQKAVNHNGKIYMWYIDDSTDLSYRTYLVTSSDGFNFSTPVETNLPNLFFDIKFNPTTNSFVMLGLPIPQSHAQNPYAVSATSLDGINWSSPQTSISSPPLPQFSNTIAISSDENGNLINEDNPLIITSVPYNMAKTDTWGKWDLYGTFSLNPFKTINCPTPPQPNLKYPINGQSIPKGEIEFSWDIPAGDTTALQVCISTNQFACDVLFTKFDPTARSIKANIPNPDDLVSWSVTNINNCNKNTTSQGIFKTIGTKLGDTNSDGQVNLLDFAVWKKEYLDKLGSTADLNKDNTVNLLDFSIWKSAYLSQ